MELREYVWFLWLFKWWLLVGLIVGIAVGGGYALSRADRYEADMSLYVQRQPDPQNGQYFTYEGYYAQQVATAYTDTALKLLTNDEIVKRAAESAQLSTTATSLSGLKSDISSKKDAPQLIKVSVTMPTKDQATAFSEGLAEALKQRTTELNQVGDARLSIDPVNTTPFVQLVRPLLPLYAGAGAVLGLLVAIVVAALWRYMRQLSQ